MSLVLDDRLRKIASDSLRAYGPGPYLAASCQEGRPSALATQLDNLLCYRPLVLLVIKGFPNSPQKGGTTVERNGCQKGQAPK